MDFLQNLIHRLEVGGGMRYFRIGLAALAVLLLLAGYDWRAYRNMNTQEAMDSAQLARNIAEGKGYTTLFIRPFSIHLLKQCNRDRQGILPPGQALDLAEIKTAHPDLANPPVYPVVLAGLMKVLPFHYQVDTTHPFWSVPKSRISNQGGRQFWRYQPDFLIALFNQFLFFLVILLTFLLARRLFDSTVAWLSAVLLLGSELLWRFSVSGLSTMLLLLIFIGLVWCLVLLEAELRQPRWGRFGVFILAGAIGLLTGLGALTRYSFAWLILPVLLFVILFTGRQRVILGLTTFFVFAALLTPWIVRNYSLSGTPFGTATYTVVEDTYLFPEYKLQRSLDPDLNRSFLSPFWQKLVINSRRLVTTDLPKLGGSWVSAFFLVGLLLGYRNPAVRRLRYFLVASLLVLALAQALGRTQLSEDSPQINSENLLVLLAPLVLVYGVSLFFLLLDQIHLPLREMRYGVMGLFGGLVCLPLFLAFLPPTSAPVTYPPYYPPAIQTVAGWMKENELTMSDVPWAMAWYGQRQSVWLTLNAQSDFFAINDYEKPISALYLTPETMDGKFLTQWILAGEQSWGSFILESIVKKEVPPTFPLRKTQPGWLPQQLVLTDWERWRRNQ